MIAFVLRILLAMLVFGVQPLSVHAAEGGRLATMATTLSRAVRLIKAHKPDAAYTLLIPLEEELAGRKDYDYLLGLAELDSGRAELATIALARVLVVDPKFAGARIALARADFDMGNYKTAGAVFRKVLTYHPPPRVRAVVARYLAAIRKHAKAGATKVSGYVLTRFGYDNNVSNGPGVTSFQVPALNNLNVTLAATNRKSGAYYGELAEGIAIEHHLGKGLGLYAGLNLNQRDIPDDHTFDQSGVNGTFGIMLGSAPDTVRIGGFVGQSFLSDTKLYHSVGLNASWQHLSGRRDLWTVFGQASSIRYNDISLISNGVDSLLAGVADTHAVDNRGKLLVSASFYGGYERDAHHRADGAKSLMGVNLGTQAKLTGHVLMYGSFGAQLGDYKRRNTAFLTTRYDRVYFATVGLAWTLVKDVTLGMAYHYISNLSTIVINQYNRTNVSMTLRWAFNR